MMKNKTYVLNTLLAAALALTMLIFVLVDAFYPAVILPQINIPNLVALMLLVLLVEYYIAPNASRCYVCVLLLSCAAFGLIPMAAGYAAGMDAVKLAVVGGVVFTIVTWLFSSITDRLSSGPKAHGAIWISALALWLASQCFAGMIL